MLFAYPLIDQASYALDDYFQRAVHDLDEAAGTHITIMNIGDPEQCGKIHRGLRSEELRESDTRDAEDYVARIYNQGREQHHRLGEMRELQRLLELSPEDIPCIAFLSRTGERPAGTLHALPSWYNSTESLKTFDERLRSWLAQEDVKRLATADLDESDLAARLQPLLAELAAAINDGIGLSDKGIGSRQAAPLLVLDEPRSGKLHKGNVARLIGRGPFRGVDKRLGARELFFVHALFKSEEEHSLNGESLTVVTEEKMAESLCQWRDFEFLTFRGDDTPQHRLQKMWNQFQKTITKEGRLRNRFKIVKTSDKKLFCLSLRPCRTESRIQDPEQLFEEI